MKEIDFYPEICLKMEVYLEYYLPKNIEFAYAYNQTLPQLIKELETKLSPIQSIQNQYIPSLKLDVVFGFKLPNQPQIKVILLEVKYANQLTLANFSQLSGYLQVAKFIPIGILYLVDKRPKNAAISNDFSEIINMNELPMNWKMIVKQSDLYQFKTGILVYLPTNGMDWLNTSSLNGISSFEEFIETLMS